MKRPVLIGLIVLALVAVVVAIIMLRKRAARADELHQKQVKAYEAMINALTPQPAPAPAPILPVQTRNLYEPAPAAPANGGNQQ